MSTYIICFYKEVDKSKQYSEIACWNVFIGVCVVIILNLVLYKYFDI